MKQISRNDQFSILHQWVDGAENAAIDSEFSDLICIESQSVRQARSDSNPADKVVLNGETVRLGRSAIQNVNDHRLSLLDLHNRPNRGGMVGAAIHTLIIIPRVG